MELQQEGTFRFFVLLVLASQILGGTIEGTGVSTTEVLIWYHISTGRLPPPSYVRSGCPNIFESRTQIATAGGTRPRPLDEHDNSNGVVLM